MDHAATPIIPETQNICDVCIPAARVTITEHVRRTSRTGRGTITVVKKAHPLDSMKLVGDLAVAIDNFIDTAYAQKADSWGQAKTDLFFSEVEDRAQCIKKCYVDDADLILFFSHLTAVRHLLSKAAGLMEKQRNDL
jgi:hypothetical protein